jgi:uncharacterized membrane protein YeaQ/YmgE (transglycosylase-associated protein family)
MQYPDRMIRIDSPDRKEEIAKNMQIFSIAGGVIGWIASIFTRTDTQQGVVLNIVVGIDGSALGGILLALPLGIPTLTQGGGFNFASLGVSLGGSIILLAVWNLFQRGQIR